jgi:glycosyltransferase involved in cell wall biosynthesis
LRPRTNQVARHADQLSNTPELIVQIVSVVIPTFNSSEHIRQAIESAVGQTYGEIEIVVVDDGSTDNTLELARNYLERSSRRWQLLSLGQNKGPSAARNVGYRASSGSWIQFLDSDDVLMPGKIEAEMSVATKDVGQAVVYSPWGWGFSEAGQMKWLGPANRPFVAGKHPIMCLAGGCRPLLGSSLVRRSALDQVSGFDEKLRFWECEEINVRLATVGGFVPVQIQLPQYLWRLRSAEIYIGGPGSRYSSKEVALGWITEAVKAADNRPLKDLGLSDDDRRLFLKECTLWGRLIYSQYRQAFGDYLRLLRVLDPNATPAYPRYISLLSRLVGYETAEALAKISRQPKVLLRSMLCRLGLRRPNMLIELK